MKRLFLLSVLILLVSSCSFPQAYNRIEIDTVVFYSPAWGSGVEAHIDTSTTLLNLWWYEDNHTSQANIGVGSVVFRGAVDKYPITVGPPSTPTSARSITWPDTSGYVLVSGGTTLMGYLKSAGDKIVTASDTLTPSRIGIGVASPSEILDASVSGGNTIGQFTTYDNGGSSNSQFAFRHSGGTSASPDSTAASKTLGTFSFRGRTNNGFTGTKARINVTSRSAFARGYLGADSSTATGITFGTTNYGSTTLTDRVIIDANGYVGVLDLSPTYPLTVGNGELFGISTTGGVAKLNNVTAEGAFGVPTIVDTVTRGSQTATINATNFSSSSTAGMYEVGGFLEVTGTSAAQTITVTIGWTDAIGATTVNAINLFSTTSTGRTYFSPIPIKNTSGSITWTVTVSGGTPTYNMHLYCKRLW